MLVALPATPRRRALWSLPAGVVVTLFLLALPSAAAGAVNGQLKQLPLAQGGCIAPGGAGGCKSIVAQIGNVGEPAMSPDGRKLYVPDRAIDALLVFDRNPTTGVLTERACFSFGNTPGCTNIGVPPLQDAVGAAVSPDGKSLYVVGGTPSGPAADGIVHFTLDATGMPSYDSCVSTAGGSCAQAPALEYPVAVAVSPDGTSVYVVTLQSQSIVVFNRNPTTGTLNQVGLSNAQRCMQRDGASGCTANPLIEGPRDVEVTPDGKQVAVVSASRETVGCDTLAGCYNLFLLDRNSATGVLTLHPGTGGCISVFPKAQCQSRNFFYGPVQIAITPDGRRIFTTMRGASNVQAVMVSERNPTTGDLTPLQHCVDLEGSPTNCPVKARGLADPFDIALSPNGRDLYTSGFNGSRIGVFDLTGSTLSPKPDPFGCLTTAAVAGCTSLQQGTNIEYVIPSPDGRFVYAMGRGRIFTFAVDRAPVCRNVSVSTPFNTAVTIKLDCTDPDGDPLTFRKLSDPAKGQLGALQPNGTITYGPLVGTTGADSFRFTATAAGVTADPATVTINVAPPAGGGGSPPPAVLPAGIDADGDGFFAGQDCNDNDPAIRPGAVEIKGNRIDENCDGVAEPFPTLTSGVVTSWSVKGSRITLRTLQITQQFPRGWKVRILCKGNRCPFKSKNLRKGKVRRGASNVIGSLRRKQRLFRAGQTIEVWVSAPGYNTKVARYRLRRNRIPTTQPFCVIPGQTRPQKTCS